MSPSETSDYTALFGSDASWSKAAHSVRVFKTSTQFLLHGSDDDLRQMISNLDRRGISLALEALMIPKHQACGAGLEGYSAPGTIEKAARRVKQLGGVLSYVAMDEPIWFGHHDAGANACHDNIRKVAELVAENVTSLRQVFPDIQVGDIEPMSSSGTPPDWPEEIMAFAEAYHAVTGTPLSFFHADISWNRNWRGVLTELEPRLHQAGIRFGIIYDGDPDDDTDLAWTRHAEERFETVESQESLRPDDVILQTWMHHPTHFLPEDQPGTMTNLVLRYARAEPHLSVSTVGMHITGHLTGAGGDPIANAPIDFSTVDMVKGGNPTDRSITGTVPSGANSAVAAIRVNAECDCSGSGSLSFGNSRYQDAGGGQKPQGLDMPSDGGPVTIQPGQKFMRTGASFPVVAGLPFTFDIALDASATLEYGGYAALIFLNDQHKEFRRLTTRLSPSELPFGHAVTDATGNFNVDLPSGLDGSTILKARFAGNDAIRGITAIAK